MSLTPDAGRSLQMPEHPVANLRVWLTRFIRQPRAAAVSESRRRLVLATVAILVGLAVVIWYMQFDAFAITQARKLPTFIIGTFNWLTDFGKSGWFLWPLGLLLLAAIPLTALLPRYGALVVSACAVRAAFLFLAIALPGLFTDLIKGIIGRARPFVGGAADPFLYSPFTWQAKYASLPSGHATTAAAVAIAFGTLWPRARPYLWTYAAIIMASRVIITAHHPSDVIAGALVGAAGALMIRNYFAARGLAVRFTPDGHVRAFAMPSWARIKGIARQLVSH